MKSIDIDFLRHKLYCAVEMTHKKLRKGPTPLPLHLGLMALQHNGVGVQNDGQGRLEKAILGIQRYVCSDVVIERPELDCVWSDNGAKLRKLARVSYEPDWPVIVLIPSLINKSDIFNLMNEHSFIAWLVDHQCAAYLLDWDGLRNDKQDDLEYLIAQQIPSAIHFLRDQHQQKIHALGYCMAGTMLAGAASFAGEDLASIIFLAAPWDFQAGRATFHTYATLSSPAMMLSIEQRGGLSVDWLQGFFASLNPQKTVQKFAAFYGYEDGSEQMQKFIALEDWANDGIALPKNLAQHCIQKWFIDNETGQGQWEIQGRSIDITAIDCPAFVIASKQDQLIDYDCAHSLHQSLKDSVLLDPDCGHLGMMVGRQSKVVIWEKVLQWVHDNSL